MMFDHESYAILIYCKISDAKMNLTYCLRVLNDVLVRYCLANQCQRMKLCEDVDGTSLLLYRRFVIANRKGALCDHMSLKNIFAAPKVY